MRNRLLQLSCGKNLATEKKEKVKSCSKCKKTKELDDFYFYKKRDRHYSCCKSCHNEAQVLVNKKWRRENPIEFRRRRVEINLKSKYGITLETIDSLLKLQNNSCAICKTELLLKTSDRTKRFNVDHNHVTGEVRGLLCLTCNMGLGLYNDSVELLENAKQYLLK